MPQEPFDNLPELTFAESIGLLSKDINDIQMLSDYYKAVFHLEKFPGQETEKVLIAFLGVDSNHQSVTIAQRKAIEVLGNLKCKKAEEFFIRGLSSSDPYLVENSSIALTQIGCKDIYVHEKISSLLDDPTQNRRVLIQSLAALGAVSELRVIKDFINNLSVSPGIRGASIAAVKKLTGENKYSDILINNLSLINQNERQCAIQDVIDSEKIDLLPIVIKTPVSPFFRIRAVEKFWPDDLKELNNLDPISLVDFIIFDNPRLISTFHYTQDKKSIRTLLKELFGTDFSRCFSALKDLILIEKKELWFSILAQLEDIGTDYGALYFFCILFRNLKPFDGYVQEQIKDFLCKALDGDWPNYIKFRPSAIITLFTLDPEFSLSKMHDWLNQEKNPYWLCRYAVLFSLEKLILDGKKSIIDSSNVQINNMEDNRFVREKFRRLLTLIE